nr:HAD hydrolase-like protein [Vallitaleaceae bacterium]
MKYKYILFDLDGTLTDPKVGITKSVAYSLKKMRDMDVDTEELTKFIGPPLKDSYMDFYDFTEEEAEEAIACYREYFKETGIYENEVYDGIRQLLGRLQALGHILVVATSKPTVFAETIINHFDLEGYFTCIVGSYLDGRRTNKAEVIEAVINALSIHNEKNKVIMIGDRKHDIIGAKTVGVDAIGVIYGYGSYDELEKAG